MFRFLFKKKKKKINYGNNPFYSVKYTYDSEYIEACKKKFHKKKDYMVYFEDEYEFVVITCLNNYFWIKRLKKKITFTKLDYKNVENESCSICLENFKETDNNIFKISQCGHKYHDICISGWLKHSRSCPCCRFNINSDMNNIEILKKNLKRLKN